MMAPVAEAEAVAEDAWEAPPRAPSIPELHLEGFDGPMDLLLDLAERQRIDLGRMSVRDLVEQFVTAMARLAGTVAIERQADWLVLATRLVLLRSRLLFPASPQEAATAEQDAALEEQRLSERLRMRAAAAWLEARPQLGQDVFARGRPGSEARTGSTMALMDACLVVLRGPGNRPEAAPVYRPDSVRLWRVDQALARIRQLLAEDPEGRELGRFMPAAGPGADQPRWARGAMASTFVACLELARQGEVMVEQSDVAHQIWVRQPPLAPQPSTAPT